MQPFNTKFTLSREYLAECFDQSLPYGKNAKPNYLFPALLLIIGSGLLFFTDQSKSLSSIFIVLAVIELIHIRFRRAWWLTRQMWGRSGDSEIELSIDDNGFQTRSPYTETTVLWTDIERIIETELGLILVAKSGGQQYLSKSLFSKELVKQIVASITPR